MKKTLILGSIAAISTISSSFASITMSIQVGELRKFGGSLVDDNTVAILVADTNGNGFDFTNTLNGVSLLAGESIDGDLILQTFQVDITGNGFTGIVGNANFNVTTGNPAGTTPVGSELAILWFDGITGLNTTISTGQKFGVISNQAVNTGSGGTIGTVTPADTTTPTLAFLDNTLTGNASGLNNDFFTADMTVVPEPSSTALLGLGSVALLLRRRR